MNAQGKDGQSALHKILHWAKLDLDAVRLLLDHGISTTATDKNGDPAFASVMDALDDKPEPDENQSELDQ